MRAAPDDANSVHLLHLGSVAGMGDQNGNLESLGRQFLGQKLDVILDSADDRRIVFIDVKYMHGW